MLMDVDADKRVKAYRGDIDGLRAIAVISVMCFHFSIWPFTGGFVGVDVFFVISGYLITGGILKEESYHNFSFSDFYIRRARRLFPALLFTIAISYILSLVLFSPVDFQKMSASTMFALLGISNFYFWMSADYFDSLSILKPILHTWSLSVELQFYLIWPLLLVYLSKHGKKHVAAGSILLTILGFFLSIYAIGHDSTGAYYLTQYRFYEFSAGGLIFLVRRSKIYLKIEKFHFAIFCFGLTLIFYSVFKFSSKTIFPGISALVPVVGAMLVILSGDKTKASSLLTLRPINYIGEISYSVYLVHWPVVVFTQYILVRDPSLIDGLALIAASFLIAIPLHRFIEKPFRNPNTFNFSGEAFCYSCALFAVALIIPSTLSWAGNGWSWRVPEQVRKINNINIKAAENYLWERHSSLLSKHSAFKNNGKEKIILVGDSQSADILNMLFESGDIDKYDYVIRLIYTECGVPYINKPERDSFFTSENTSTIQRSNLIPECHKQMDLLMDEPTLKQASKIYISMLWRPEVAHKIPETLVAIKMVSASEIYLFGNKTLSKGSISIVNSFGRVAGIDAYASEQRDKASENVNQYLAQLKGIHYVDMMKLTCPKKDSCNVLTNDFEPVFFDKAHLTKNGAAYLGSRLSQVISSATSS